MIQIETIVMGVLLGGMMLYVLYLGKRIDDLKDFTVRVTELTHSYFEANEKEIDEINEKLRGIYEQTNSK